LFLFIGLTFIIFVSNVSNVNAAAFSAAAYTYKNCTDSDGGKDYDVKGGATYVYDYTDSRGNVREYTRTFTDVCRNYSPNPSTTYNLQEYSCDSGNRAVGSYYNCPNGCSDGACVSSECTDECNPDNYPKCGGDKNEYVLNCQKELDGCHYETSSTTPCANGCQAGACSPYECTDPDDDGTNYYRYYKAGGKLLKSAALTEI